MVRSPLSRRRDESSGGKWPLGPCEESPGKGTEGRCRLRCLMGRVPEASPGLPSGCPATAWPCSPLPGTALVPGPPAPCLRSWSSCLRLRVQMACLGPADHGDLLVLWQLSSAFRCPWVSSAPHGVWAETLRLWGPSGWTLGLLITSLLRPGEGYPQAQGPGEENRAEGPWEPAL